MLYNLQNNFSIKQAPLALQKQVSFSGKQSVFKKQDTFSFKSSQVPTSSLDNIKKDEKGYYLPESNICIEGETIHNPVRFNTLGRMKEFSVTVKNSTLKGALDTIHTEKSDITIDQCEMGGINHCNGTLSILNNSTTSSVTSMSDSGMPSKLIAENSYLGGSVYCDNADFNGCTVTGSVNGGNDLAIKSNSEIKGMVLSEKGNITISESSVFSMFSPYIAAQSGNIDIDNSTVGVNQISAGGTVTISNCQEQGIKGNVSACGRVKINDSVIKGNINSNDALNLENVTIYGEIHTDNYLHAQNVTIVHKDGTEEKVSGDKFGGYDSRHSSKGNRFGPPDTSAWDSYL